MTDVAIAAVDSPTGTLSTAASNGASVPAVVVATVVLSSPNQDTGASGAAVEAVNVSNAPGSSSNPDIEVDGVVGEVVGAS